MPRAMASTRHPFERKRRAKRSKPLIDMPKVATISTLGLPTGPGDSSRTNVLFLLCKASIHSYLTAAPPTTPCAPRGPPAIVEAHWSALSDRDNRVARGATPSASTGIRSATKQRSPAAWALIASCHAGSTLAAKQSNWNTERFDRPAYLQEPSLHSAPLKVAVYLQNADRFLRRHAQLLAFAVRF